MSTLAYFSSLVKKEDFINRISTDAEESASIANDLVCHLKIFVSSCRNKNLESCFESLEESEKTIKLVNAMLQNIRNNLEGYTSSLLPAKEQEENQNKETKNEKQQEKPSLQENQISEIKNQPPDASQINSLVETLKTLKEMKDSISK